MHHLPARKRIPRLTAVLVLLAAFVGSVSTAISAPPASAVPVDGLYGGTIFSGATSAVISVRLSTSAPGRGPVTASITISPGATVQCFGGHDLASTFSLPGSGGVPSAAPRGTAAVNFTGTAMVMGNNIPVTVNATITPNRTMLIGTASLSLPATCGTATVSFTAFSDKTYAIRTGHDGVVVGATDLTHMIDRQLNGTATPWERCMYLWATPPATPPTTSATWSVEPGAPAGAHIKAGWQNGATTGDGAGPPSPLRTMVCITDATPLDTTFTVDIAPNAGAVAGRVLLWVGNFTNYAGRAQGDVHNTTFDEMHYDFQGVGEYVDAVAADGRDFAVQSRLETVPTAPVTVTTAIAARVNGDRVAIYLDASSVAQWYLDGAPLSMPATLPSGGKITNPSPDHWKIYWPDTTTDPGATTGTTMQVSLARWTPRDHLNIDELVLGPGLGDGQVRGLLGIADRNPANDLTPSTGGSPVSPDIDPALPPYTQPLYREFGQSWLVSTSRSDTLFDYLDPSHPDSTSYENREFPSERPGVIDPKAEAECRKAGVEAFPQIDFCTYDVGVTGATEIAGYYHNGWLPVSPK